MLTLTNVAQSHHPIYKKKKVKLNMVSNKDSQKSE